MGEIKTYVHTKRWTKRLEMHVVPASKLHFSRILPRRDGGSEVAESIRRIGVRVPLIVRPSEENPEEFEIIDGALRRSAINEDQGVIVAVLYGWTDSEVFRIHHATSKTKQRTTSEWAEYYTRWVQTVGKERGKAGAQAKVARMAGVNEGEICQYIAIHKMYMELIALAIYKSVPINLDALKNQSINKLYELSKLRGTPNLLQVAKELADHPNMSIRKLRRIVKEKMKKPLKRVIKHRKSGSRHKIKRTEVNRLTQKLLKTINETKKNLKTLEKRMQLTPETYMKSRIPKELQRLQRRFKELQKNISRLQC